MTLVVFMGVLIVIGLGLVGYGVYREMNGRAPEVRAPAVGAADIGATAPHAGTPEDRAGSLSRSIQQPILPAPFAATLNLPRGASVKSVGDAGGRLAVVVSLPSGEERILLLDPANGAILGTIAVGAP